jgi:hypothetical protein
MKITLNLTVDEVNVVLAGLGKLPLEAGIAVFESIKTQAQPQLQDAPAAPAPVVQEPTE